MRLIVTIDDAATPLIAGMLQGYGGARAGLVRSVAQALQEHLKVAAPVGRHHDLGGSQRPGGALRDSLTFEIGPDGAALFGAQHGLYVIAGVGAHPIAVRQARALRFYWEKRGVVFIGPSVNHPGAPVNDFRLRALSLAFGDGTLERAVSQFWQSMFQAGGL